MVYPGPRHPRVYQAIFHDMNVGSNVAHAFLTDGEHWIYTSNDFERYEETNIPLASFTYGDTMGRAHERLWMTVKTGTPTHTVIGGIPKALEISEVRM